VGRRGESRRSRRSGGAPQGSHGSQ
jgi:hypothetical protein